jgi:hypothetical protein
MLPVISSFLVNLAFFDALLQRGFHLYLSICVSKGAIIRLFINYFIEEITKTPKIQLLSVSSLNILRSLFYQVSNNFIRPLLSYAAEFSANRQHCTTDLVYLEKTEHDNVLEPD